MTHPVKQWDELREQLRAATNMEGRVRRNAPATSKAAAHDIKLSSGTQRWRVLQAIVAHGPITRDYLEEILGMNPSALRPRVKELLDAGFIFVAPKIGRSRSGRNVQRLAATPKGKREIG